MAKREPNQVEETPAGHRVEFYDSTGVDGKPQKRRYVVDGERLPSVTTITNLLDKPGVLWWAVNLERQGIDHTEHKDEAAERGKQAHAVIVKMMAETGTIGELPSEYRPWGQAAAKWMLSAEPEVIAAEAALVGDGYSGRMDLLAKIEGKTTLVDFKSVTKWPVVRKSGILRPPYTQAALQANGYAEALPLSGYPSAEQLLIVRLGPDARWRQDVVPMDPDTWHHLLFTYQGVKKLDSAMWEGMPEW